MHVERRFLEIHPETPAEGRPVSELGYPPDQWARMMENLERMGRAEGIVFSERTFTTNSHKSLLLAEAAKEEGLDKEDIAARVGARYRAVRATLLKELLFWHRDVLLRVLQVETAGYHFATEAEAQRRQATGLSPAAALADVRRLEKLVQRLEQFPEASEAALLTAGLPQRAK